MPSTSRSQPLLRAALAMSLLCTALCTSAKPPLRLHVPSPDWRDQIIYFVVTDRFDDGNPANNDQGAGEFNPARHDRYSGGDLAGLRRRLDYIQGLGATALWITPPVANQWLNAQGSYSGYHGYWTEHFMKVDRHLGSLHDYRLLSDALHRRGLYLVQDIVVNHVGDFFYYGRDRRDGEPRAGWTSNADSRPVTAPTQRPFHLNDPRRAADRAAGIYHWTPDITDYQNRQQELTFQMAGLDDLATGNPRVRDALRRSYAHWIREVGVDAFRVDTAFYVEPEFFEDFLWRPAGRGAATPGMQAVARSTGRQDFFVFGEGFGIDAPGQDTQGRKIESYMQGPTPSQRRMHGMLNFPLYGALGDVLARGAPTAVLGQRLRSQARLHPRLHWMPTFLDNHDVDRFLAGADERALSLGLAAQFTLPGIPVVYYGTEQGFTAQRPSMFAAGWGSGGRDHFNTQAPLYRLIRSLADLRHGWSPLRRGTVEVLAETADAAGALVWRMRDGPRHALMALNTDDEPVTLPALAVASPGQALEPAWGLDGLPPALQADGTGRAGWTLPPRSMQVWRWTDERAEPATAPEPVVLQSGDPTQPWATVLDVVDPAGDDRGPSGRYVYPSDPTFQGLNVADIRRVQVATRVEGASQSLRITLTMADLSTVWSPRNGFDHVAFTLFLELPGQPAGSRLMPLQNGELPQDMRWHRRLRSHGWSLALFAADGAADDAASEGRPLSRGVKVQADTASRTVTFTFSAAALGRPASLSGARLWINTWDWDSRYRELGPQAKPFGFGGGQASEPLVMDATDVLVLP